MSLQILSLNSNQVPSCAAAQEKILALLSGDRADGIEPKRFDTAKQLFYALAEALKTARTVLLLVEPGRYLHTKEQLLRVLGLSAVQNPELLEALHGKGAVQLPEEEMARHAAIPAGAAAFPTQDGLFSGFMLTAGSQTILFLPLDNRRIDGILQAEAGAFLSGLQLVRQTRPTEPQAHTQGKQQEAEPSEAQEETQAAPPSGQTAAEQAVVALCKSDIRVAFAATPTVEFLREAAGDSAAASERLVYSSAFRERGEEPAKQYAAELAQQAMQEKGTELGAAITNVYTVKKEGRVETFLLLAVADENGARVRRLYAQPDEHPGLLIGDGVQTLYELIEQAACQYGQKDSEEQQERPAHWKAFAAVLSVLLSLSILLCMGTGIFLRSREDDSSQQASLSAVNAPGVQQTQPESFEPGSELVGTQSPDMRPQETVPSKSVTASSFKKPVAPAKDQAILDEVAQAMEDELNVGGKKEEETTQQPDTATNTTGKGDPDTTKATQTTLPPNTDTSTHLPTQKDGGKFIFTVYGYGHGVGMSQFGANEFAKSGWNYRQILLHYFPGVQMQKMDGRYPQTLEVDGKQVDTKIVLARILEKEMGGSYHLEALKAQAVAAYTYILRQNRVTGVAIGSTYSARSMQAVDSLLSSSVKFSCSS